MNKGENQNKKINQRASKHFLLDKIKITLRKEKNQENKAQIRKKIIQKNFELNNEIKNQQNFYKITRKENRNEKSKD